MSKRQRLSYEERLVIEKSLDEGKSFLEISRILGRTGCCIGQEVERNGGLRKYNAKSAEERYVSINCVSPEHSKSVRIKSSEDLRKAVEDLKDQIYVLTQLIKERP